MLWDILNMLVLCEIVIMSFGCLFWYCYWWNDVAYNKEWLKKDRIGELIDVRDTHTHTLESVIRHSEWNWLSWMMGKHMKTLVC